MACGTVDMVILNAGISVGHSEEITPFKEFKKLCTKNFWNRNTTFGQIDMLVH